MTIVKRPPLFIHGLLLAGVISLAACGGGGGGDKKVIDTTPDAFAFSAASNAQPNTSITSSPVTVTGINSATPITIVGGEYSINGRAFTAAPGTINNGQTLAVRITASDKTNTPKEAVVNVGGVTATFTVTTSADVTPDSFTFAPVEEAEINTEYTSASVNIQGIDVDVPVAIEGGTYSIDGGAFTAATGTISNGQTLTLRVTSAEKTYTPKEAVVKVGEVTAKFTVTTFADVTPDAFTFTPVKEATLNTEYASSVVTVKGIDVPVPVPVSINGGVYSINGGAFTSAAGTVSADQTITVKVTSAPKTDTTKTAVLTIGGVTGSFAVSTFADKTPPVAEFKFPTPYTMSEANQVKVRGIATDDNAITEVKLLVRSYHLGAQDTTLDETEVEAVPASETDGVKDFSSWTANIPLTADAENEIKVIATDEKNNVIALEEANKVVIRQAGSNIAFPDNRNPIRSPTGVVVDDYEGRNRILVPATGESKIISISTATGERTVFNDYGLNQLFDSLPGLVIANNDEGPALYGVDNVSGRLYELDLENGELQDSYSYAGLKDSFKLLFDNSGNTKRIVTVNTSYSDEYDSNVVAFDLRTKSFSILSSDNDHPKMRTTRSIVLDEGRSRYLVAVADSGNNVYGIYSVDRTTGERKKFSTNDVGGGVLLDDDAIFEDLVVDNERNILYAPDYMNGKVYEIDLASGNRRVIAELTYRGNTKALVYRTTGMTLVKEAQYAFVSDGDRNAVLVLDLSSGEYVILSKSATD